MEVCVFWASEQNLMSSFAGRLPNWLGMEIPKMPAHNDLLTLQIQTADAIISTEALFWEMTWL